MSIRKQVVAVIFGGRSVEHDVSIVTANQIIKALDPNTYETIPVYISRDGKWFSGESLKDISSFNTDQIHTRSDVTSVILSPDIRHHGLIINPLAGRFQKSEVIRLDCVIPAIHGSHGEDGTLQGLLELAEIPYVGCETLSSALTNDKIMTKQIMRQYNIPVVDDIWFYREEWLNNQTAIINKINDQLKFPVFVKPATLGSSIGVSKADSLESLKISIELALAFDSRVLVENAVVNGIEINCSVIGRRDQMKASTLEQPISWDDFLSFEDKYLSGNEGMKSADRIIPAPLSEALTKQIQELSIRAFQCVNGSGIARIDYLVKPEENKIYLNEFNTMPGSLAFYLWQASDISQSKLLDLLIEYAKENQVEKRRNIYNYKTNLISVAQARGTKGIKGSKSVT